MTRLSSVLILLMLALPACTGQRNNAPQAVGPATLNVADAAIAGGDPAMALSVSRSVLQTEPNNTDALLHEADAYYAMKRCTDAIAAYTLILKIDARSSDAQTGLGRCLLKTDPKAAETAFELAITYNPGNAAALGDLGIARDLQGNFAGAVQAYQSALLAQPGSVATEVNLGLSLALSGDYGQALQYLGPLATGPDATARIRENYAAALIAAGRASEARQVLCIDLPPGQVDNAMAGFTAILGTARLALANAVPMPPPAATAAPASSVASAPLPVKPAGTPPARIAER